MFFKYMPNNKVLEAFVIGMGCHPLLQTVECLQWTTTGIAGVFASNILLVACDPGIGLSGCAQWMPDPRVCVYVCVCDGGRGLSRH